MKQTIQTLVALAILAFMPGCAQFYNKQTDVSYVDSNGQPTRKTITRTRTYTFFKSSQDVTGFKATSSDPEFTTSVEVEAQSSVTEESASNLAGKIVEGVIEGIKAGNGLP